MTDVRLTIDGRSVTVPTGTSLWDAARKLGIEIPVLCHDPKLVPVGVCRMCAVEVEGERVLAAACVREAAPDMVVQTATERVERSRDILTELLLSEQPPSSARQETTADDVLFALAERRDIDLSLFPADVSAAPRGSDDSSPVIAVDHQACILCDRPRLTRRRMYREMRRGSYRA